MNLSLAFFISKVGRGGGTENYFVDSKRPVIVKITVDLVTPFAGNKKHNIMHAH